MSQEQRVDLPQRKFSGYSIKISGFERVVVWNGDTSNVVNFVHGVQKEFSDTMYTIQVNEEQLNAISESCEFLARISIGQWREVLDYLPVKKSPLDSFVNQHWSYEDEKLLQELFEKYGVISKGISSGTDLAQTSYDIHQAIRHKISWKNAVKQGLVPSEDSKRDFSTMFGVNYDDPLKISKNKLPIIKEIEENGSN
mgnify:CR=1 FL=1